MQLKGFFKAKAWLRTQIDWREKYQDSWSIAAVRSFTFPTFRELHNCVVAFDNISPIPLNSPALYV